MTTFTPKKYQYNPDKGGGVLDSVAAFFKACHTHRRASLAFTAVTEALWGRGKAYVPLAGFQSEMPYFCLRVPTGGGKTWMAAKSVALVNQHLLRSEFSVVVWLVPSKTIREQTLRALKDCNHPYHAALRDAGDVTVMDLAEAKSVRRATLESSTVVIVATRQAFQVNDEESRKVYESSGELMHHFDGLSPQERAPLLNEDGTVTYSLANVLRHRRPFVIVDDAHNSRTELAFDTLAKFRPSGIMELAATPDLVKTPSNVLHSVGAAELKAEEMIKLPVVLETEPNWQQCIADGLARREALQKIAEDEQRAGALYLRPIVLIQAQPRQTGNDTLDVDRVRRELLENHQIPSEEIVVATSDERGLEKIDAEFSLGILDPDCPVKYVITQRALAEGWDCPFAYVLISLASIQSSTVVEQLLGRILRQPNAKHRTSASLNKSYAFVHARNFAETAAALRDRLVADAGFNRVEVADFVTAARGQDSALDLFATQSRMTYTPVVVALEQTPDLRALPKAIRDKVEFDAKAGSLKITTPLSVDETEALKQAMPTRASDGAIEQAAEASRTTAIHRELSPIESGEKLAVPQLAIWVQNEFVLFEDVMQLDYPWELSVMDAPPTNDQLSALGVAFKVSEGGELDVDATTGKMVERFIVDLQRDLGFAYEPENWDRVKLAAWLCRRVDDSTLTHETRMTFVLKWLSDLESRPTLNLAKLNQQKFFLSVLLITRVSELRTKAATASFQANLFGSDNATRVSVTDQFTYRFGMYDYAPSADYDGRFGVHDFRKHFYLRVGDFDSREEFMCAGELDKWAQQGKIKYWVRNLARKEHGSFFLQKATGKFFPDFVCKLTDDTILVVEYKGADRWSDARDDREIGALWAELSVGRCKFVMVKEKRWDQIESLL